MQIMSDTHPEIERIQIDWMRTAPAWKKVNMWGQMHQTMKQLSLAGLRHRYPNASGDELRRRLADLMLGPELAETVYGAMPFPEVSDAH